MLRRSRWWMRAAAGGLVASLPGAPGSGRAEALPLDAVLATLARDNPDVRLAQTEIDRSGALLRQATGQFALHLDSTLSGGQYTWYSQYEGLAGNAATPLIGQEDTYYSSEASVLAAGTTLSTQTRWGGLLSGSVSLSHSRFALAGERRVSSVLGGRLALSVPLLRSWRPEVNAGEEEAARAEVGAARLAATAELSRQTRRAVAAYWGLAAGQETSGLLVRAAERQARLVTEVEQLVTAGRRTASDLNLARAQALEVERDRIQVTREVGAALAELHEALGAGRDAATQPPPRRSLCPRSPPGRTSSSGWNGGSWTRPWPTGRSSGRRRSWTRQRGSAWPPPAIWPARIWA